MPSSPSSPRQGRLFGLDMNALWRDLLTAWRGMLEWPVFSWAWPQLVVRLHLPGGGPAVGRSLDAPPIVDEQSARTARFEALVLAEDLLLRRSLDLPKLQPTELTAALTLEIQALSPFAPGDLTWAHEVGSQGGSSMRVHVVLCSRKLIELRIEALHPQPNSPPPEVWVPRFSGPGFLVLPGFGEARRQRQSTVWRWASALLALLALALIVAMAVTPSAKLYLRALQANQAMTSLGQKAGPVIAQRESLVRASDQLTNLALLTDKPVPPLKTLKLITDVLPDDTSLLSLQIQGLKVSITGQTANAAALMKQLGSTPGLRDVKAPTPATKPLGAPRESFTIEFTLDPAQLKPAS